MSLLLIYGLLSFEQLPNSILSIMKKTSVIKKNPLNDTTQGIEPCRTQKRILSNLLMMSLSFASYWTVSYEVCLVSG